MISLLRNRMGIPGIISVIALVFAMSGGAFAAKDYLGEATTSAKKKNKKSKRGPRGPRGKPGKAGPAGPAGPAGQTGPAGPAGQAGSQGDKGDPGSAGLNGSPGTNGQSVTSEALLPDEDPECPDGGSKFTAAGSSVTYACNGETGFTPTLPSGMTETGTWSSYFANGSQEGLVPISFAIPLAAPLGAANVIIVPEGGTPPADCENSDHAGAASVANPEAKAGFLCVYTQTFLTGVGEVAAVWPASEPYAPTNGAGTSGAIVRLSSPEPEDAGIGSFAVTAP